MTPPLPSETVTLHLTPDEARTVWNAVTSLRRRVGQESVQATIRFNLCSAVRAKIVAGRKAAR